MQTIIDITSSIKKLQEQQLSNLNKLKCLNISLDELLKKINNLYDGKITPSQTAIGGYNEEQYIADKINSLYKNDINDFLHVNCENFQRTKNNTKTDVSDGQTNTQVKKYKKRQFGQIDRHWVKYLIKCIPELQKVEHIFKGLCECKVVNNVCNKTRIKISKKNYSQKEISEFLLILNDNKEKIIRYALCGYNKNTEPNLLCGVEYVNNERKKITFYKMVDVIKYLLKYNFKIRPSCTVIELGQSFTIQRKGGDNGKPCANHIQFKLVFSELKICDKLEYIV